MLQLNHCAFRFSISRKTVGLFSYRPHFYECGDFKVLFNLWGNGGANRKSEVGLSIEKKFPGLMFIARTSSTLSFADVHKIRPVSGANMSSLSENQSLIWFLSKKPWSLIIWLGMIRKQIQKNLERMLLIFSINLSLTSTSPTVALFIGWSSNFFTSSSRCSKIIHTTCRL
jgi:hypothetical protein